MCSYIYVRIYRSLGKIQQEKILSDARYIENYKHTKIFLPQRNRAVYNGL